MNGIKNKYIENRDRRRDFRLWQKDIVKQLPELVIKFYTAKLKGVKIESNDEKQLGFVIEQCNNPYYNILDKDRNHYPSESDSDAVIMAELLLEIEVERIIELINSLDNGNV